MQFHILTAQPVTISSPDKKIMVRCNPEKLIYTISFNGNLVLQDSKLGIIRADEEFSKNLIVINVSPPVVVTDTYSMLNAKKKNITYAATERIIETNTVSGKKLNIIFRVSNDGVAFRYKFPEQDSETKHIISEATSFHFVEGTRAWMQPKAEAQSGFEHTNPSYEAHYEMDIPVGTPAPGLNGWVYPALFKHKETWIMLTETDLGSTYCGTALQQNSEDGEYKINFPQASEKFSDGALNPTSTLPWTTPWRIIAIGSLKTIMESTLGTDLAESAKNIPTAFIKPGKAAWSWILEKDDSTIFSVQKRYIDFAADMHWQYCLIDANWDKLIGYDSIKLLVEYGRQKGVSILLWYNSAGDWNTVKFTPRDKLLTHENRIREFAYLQSIGVKGIKVDFFGGDGQSMINYYNAILKDAATYQLLCNFHGATLPRGLQRTYPNLMTVEAVFGYEMITFGQEAADAAPQHMIASAMIRNNFDPMDFTPMNLYKIPNIKRKTTAAFELATSVVFLSGIQHYAESPEGMAHVPEFVKNFLLELPDSWDDVKFIDGYPGKMLVVARRSGNQWYLAGLNGDSEQVKLTVDLLFLKNRRGNIITTATSDKVNYPSFHQNEISLPRTGKTTITLEGYDGFVAVFE